MEDSNNDKSISLTYQSTPESSVPPDLRILAYNDVYHIEGGSAEPVGGIARFQTIVNQYRSDPQYANQPKLITLFSGDAFNPSLESSITKGRHMVPILNNIGTDVACVGVSMDPRSFLPSAIWSVSLLIDVRRRTMISISECSNSGI